MGHLWPIIIAAKRLKPGPIILSANLLRSWPGILSGNACTRSSHTLFLLRSSSITMRGMKIPVEARIIQVLSDDNVRFQE
jgi:hypothetical protein